MYNLNDAEWYYNQKTKEAMHRDDYLKLLDKEVKGNVSIDAIIAVQRRLGFEFCYRYEDGTFKLGDGTVLNGLEETDLEKLTPTEQKVADLAKRGMTNRQIAEELNLAEGTIRTHISKILIKLKIKSRRALK